MVGAAAAATLTVAALALAACGGEGEGDETDAVGVGQVRAGSVAQLAQCSDWIGGSEEARRATVTDIRTKLSEAGADGPTPTLPDEEAYELFERACANEFATGFRLYKIYARAAAFSRLPVDTRDP